MGRDIYHEHVKQALINDGWTVTHDPLFLQVGKRDVYVDLGAQKIIAAEKEGQKIAVEVKSFLNPSLIYDFHEALGQFMNYLVALRAAQEDRKLFLAITQKTWLRFQEHELIQASLETYPIHLIVVDVEHKMVAQWIK